MKVTTQYKKHHKIAICGKPRAANNILICSKDFEIYDTVHYRKATGEITHDPAILKKQLRDYLQNLQNNGYNILQRTRFKTVKQKVKRNNDQN